ncbi:amidohydrolase [Microbulbifer litoralis]|uniref:amidohydrolase n=1 Tax=Microbulbifer litoralis TaxID=2933965 RepID=UPI0020298973|nr:amidohydrolase [Microbulbifer sp. GX H0434]
MDIRKFPGLLLIILLLPLNAACETLLLHNVRGAHIVESDIPGAKVETFPAIAFDDGKVLALGDADKLADRYPDARKVDGRGRGLIPGLIDAHGHMSALGLLQNEIDLRDRSLADTLEALEKFAARRPADSWITGRGWNQVLWPGGRWPAASDLDALEIAQPVWLRRIDGHAGWANTAALRAAGIDRETEAPAGGEILRDDSGRPTGILIDNAMALMEKAIPAPSMEDRRAALDAAFELALANGLTSVHDAGIDSETYAAYRALAAENAIPMRVYPMLMAGGGDFGKLLGRGIVGTPESRLFIRSIKVVADGALGSRGAAMLADYRDQHGHSGLLLHSDKALDHFYRAALERGFQVNVHAIGDRANRQVLDKFEKYAGEADGKTFRHRIEHAQILDPADIPRLRALGLIASMQPVHATSDMNMAAERVGEERLEGAYAWRTLLDGGTRIAAGSDFPVEPVNPFFGIHAAVTRRDRQGRPPGGWKPEQKMRLAEALRAFTLDAAYAAHQEEVIGNLAPGKAADFLLLDRDIFAADPQDLWRTRVLETWVAGQRVYAR